ERCDAGYGVGATGLGVYLDFADSIKRMGENAVRERYGNLFEMYERITDENPYQVPMRIFPAPHYTMGGLWVDYNLMTTIPGMYAIGEANFSDHGSNRLGASALMQGLADGYFVIPYTIGNYLSQTEPGGVDPSGAEFQQAKEAVEERIGSLLGLSGNRSVDDFHKRLGRIMWDQCGMSRTEAGLKSAIADIRELREEFWQHASVPGSAEGVNQVLERAGRVADFLEFGELMCVDALNRNESCGGHFREEYQTAEGEALRNDEEYSYVAAWKFNGVGKEPDLHREQLDFENVKLTQRSYK
ncbi:FAD-binding protein, partial [bacterium]|nr:FAD-binding protein [bacterium]